MDEIKVLIADNSLVYKKMITQGVKEAYGNASVACAADGDEAFALIRRYNYDIIIIDAEISGKGLFELLRVIRVDIPKAFILVMVRPSSANDRFLPEVVAKGATECMIKPIENSYSDNLELIRLKIVDIIDTQRENDGWKEAGIKTEPAIVKEPVNENCFEPELILIAASTGGPQALETIMTRLRAGFSAPILIIQHIPTSFTENLARNLNQKTRIRVKVAENNETISAGTAYLAPGGAHIKLDARNRIYYDDSPPRNGLRPAADVLFESVAEDFSGTRVLTVILTGMGNDGKEGLVKLKKEKECICLAQSEETCVVYGMPRAVVEDGLADRILDLDKISSEIEAFFDFK